MIQWCAFCQKFYGFQAPEDQFVITHGICSNCYKDSPLDIIRTPRTVELRNFYENLSKAVSSFDITAINNLLDKGRKINISPEDLLIRILQPSLYELGKLWQMAGICIADEHQFTAISITLIELLFAKYPKTRPYRSVATPKILLVLAEDNQHFLGLKMVEFLLAIHKVPSLSIYPGLPAAEILRLCQLLKPAMVGISIALPQQMASVHELRQLSIDAGEDCRIIVGGYPIQQGLKIDAAAKIETHTTIEQLVARLK